MICSGFVLSLFTVFFFLDPSETENPLNFLLFFSFFRSLSKHQGPYFLNGCLSLSPTDRDCFHFLKDLSTLPFPSQSLKTRKYAILVFLWFTSFKRVIQLYTPHTTQTQIDFIANSTVVRLQPQRGKKPHQFSATPPTTWETLRPQKEHI